MLVGFVDAARFLGGQPFVSSTAKLIHHPTGPGIAALLLAMVQQQQPALAQGSGDSLVKQAVAAEGGADALRGVKGLAIKGDAKFWEPGQSFAPDGETRFMGDATFTMTWDLASGSARTAWVRDQKYPDPIVLKFTET